MSWVRSFRRSPWYRLMTPGGVVSASPNQINSTAAVTSGITGVKIVAPNGINSTASVTGTVVNIARVQPAGISSTASVTADVSEVQGVSVISTIRVRSFFRSPNIGMMTATFAPSQQTIIPNGINSTATVTSTGPVLVGAVRPGTINSKATVTTTVVKIGRVQPSQINSNATVNGTVARSTKAEIGLIYLWDSGGAAGGVVSVTPGTINSTATVSASVHPYWAVKPSGTISAATTFTASVVRTVGVPAMTFNSTATFTAVVFNTNAPPPVMDNPWLIQRAGHAHHHR